MRQTNNNYVESNGVILKLLRCDLKSFLDKCWYYDRDDDDGEITGTISNDDVDGSENVAKKMNFTL